MRLELILLTVLLSAALGAGYMLFILKSGHQRDAHLEATESVLDQGDRLLKALVYHTKLYCSTNPSPEQWRNFSALIDRVLAVRKDIQSISMRNGDITMFHRQADGTLYPDQSTLLHEIDNVNTIMSRETIDVGGRREPVFVFSRRASSDADNGIVLETTFKQSSVAEKEAIANRMINSLFTFSLSVLITAFLLCAAVIILAVIRERKRQELSRQEEHLAFSGVMANGILHDFRNPMSAVRLDAQMLEREATRESGIRPERVRELAGRVSRTMGRMDKIFAEFLFMARPDDEESGTLDIESAINECIEILLPRIEQARLKIVREIAAELPLVRAYHFALKRSLLNVFMNAIHFSPENGTILVSADCGRNGVVLEICDDGPGIPPRKRKEIFKLFVTGRPEGTGLGLFLAKTAINRCQGTIEAVESGRTRGAAIRITLPTVAPGSSAGKKQADPAGRK